MLYVPTRQYGGGGLAFQGAMLYSGDNPPYGAVFTYHLKEPLKTLKQQRVDAEKAAEKAGTPIAYPGNEQLRAEADEEAPTILLTISDSVGNPDPNDHRPDHEGIPAGGVGPAAPGAHPPPPGQRPRRDVRQHALRAVRRAGALQRDAGPARGRGRDVVRRPAVVPCRGAARDARSPWPTTRRAVPSRGGCRDCVARSPAPSS